MQKLSRILFLILPILLLLSGVAMAQGTRNLTLQEAVQLSLNHSYQLKISNAKVVESNAAVVDAKNNALPDLNITGSYMRLNHANVDLKVPLGKSNSSGTETPSAIEVNQAAYGMANVSLPLFSGLKIHYGIKSAQYLHKATLLDADRDKEELIQNTIEAYYNFYKAQSAVNLVKQHLKQVQQRVSDFENLEKNGLLARNDLLKAQLQESNAELTLLDAQNKEKITNFNMNLMLGLEKNTKLQLDISKNKPPVILKSLAEWNALALEHRSDYRSLQKKEEALETGIKAAKSNYYPSFALTGGYVAAYIPKVLTVTNALNVGLSLHYNIANLYKSGAKVKKAEAKQQQVYYANLQLRDAISIQIHQAFQNYTESLKKIKVYEKAVAQANENYRIVKNKYDNSLATTTDLLDADVSQIKAKLDYEFSKADAMIAYHKLYETAGLLSQAMIKEQK